MEITVRPRRPDDLPALAALLAAQQGVTGYPTRWPLPHPVTEFIVRPGEEAAWVAESGRLLLGHVSVTPLGAGWMADAWSRATGRAREEHAVVSVLFVDRTHGGLGIGGRLLDTAVSSIESSGRVPVLDVVGEDSPAAGFYRRRGWTAVAAGRPDWLPEHAPDVALLVHPGERVEA